MTVAELIAELSKIEDPDAPVTYLDDYGDNTVIHVDHVTEGLPSFVRLW